MAEANAGLMLMEARVGHDAGVTDPRHEHHVPRGKGMRPCPNSHCNGTDQPAAREAKRLGEDWAW
eukprot:12424908-Karenia_brevis.AAC.1